MNRIFCDCCGKETKNSKNLTPLEMSAGSPGYTDCDVCDECLQLPLPQIIRKIRRIEDTNDICIIVTVRNLPLKKARVEE